MEIKSVSVRIEEEMLEKLAYVARTARRIPLDKFLFMMYHLHITSRRIFI